jgi:hypothetical protein
MASPNGSPYKVELGPEAKKAINAIKSISEQSGKLDRFIAIMEDAIRRLESDPHHWGDPVYRAKTVEAVAYRAILRPVVFHYSVYETPRAVALVSVRLFAEFD